MKTQLLTKSIKPVVLKPFAATVCPSCGHKVRPRIYAKAEDEDPDWERVYMRCTTPGCRQTFIQRRELADTLKASHARRLVYKYLKKP